MSDEKNLSDDLNDMLGDAKEGVKKAADKAEDFADDAKETAKEFTNDAKEVLSDGKNVAIIAHITLIGWIIALVMNNGNKTEFASFYIRQMLGLIICSFVLWFVPVVGWILNLVLIVFWIMSLVGALGGEKKETPVIGKFFQDWFKSL
ncbi:YtxH domain-containing protein [Seonamhaeicola algicola]|uniref:YtxH domain-containing protein n=1 Tax=Seonamhaeicola algicola TaxID=1719036 RepID=A0A5C7B4J9_9FLAO|nr:YtxH domain-containing protein [Seonamhaeicola algicola]TXE12802.1 YtxH domain-containing protein [Seonamhaeicola algicola]